MSETCKEKHSQLEDTNRFSVFRITLTTLNLTTERILDLYI